MEKELPKWKPIRKGDKLPCQSFLRKKDGEILKLSTVGGVTVGQDAYYLPVDEVIEEIRNYPIEESEDERIRKELIEYHKAQAFLDGNPNNKHVKFVAWLENRGEQKPAEWSEEDEQLYNDLSDTYFYNDEDYPEETYKLMLKRVLDWMTKRAKSLRPQSQWKPDSSMLICLEYAIKHINKDGDKRILSKLLEQLKKLREE